MSSVQIELASSPDDHDDGANVEFPVKDTTRSRSNSLTKKNPRLSQSLLRNSTSCIKSTDVTLWRTEIDKELDAGIKADQEYFRTEQRQRQQAEFRALLEAMKQE